jgi:hypothetical protein
MTVLYDGPLSIVEHHAFRDRETTRDRRSDGVALIALIAWTVGP